MLREAQCDISVTFIGGLVRLSELLARLCEVRTGKLLGALLLGLLDERLRTGQFSSGTLGLAGAT